MNTFLWILQVALAFLYLAGGAYKAFGSAALAKQFPALPGAGWRALGVLEVLGAILLVVPGAASWMPALTALAAAVLALESLALAGLYGRSSLAPSASNPLVWSLAMGLLSGFVAYGRYTRWPLA